MWARCPRASQDVPVNWTDRTGLTGPLAGARRTRCVTGDRGGPPRLGRSGAWNLHLGGITIWGRLPDNLDWKIETRSKLTRTSGRSPMMPSGCATSAMKAA
jgi:hypothetical protein